MRINKLFKISNFFLNEKPRTVIDSILKSGTTKIPIGSPFLFGQFALLHSQGHYHYLIRDRLGINKLFYHINKTQRSLTVGNFIYDLAEATLNYNGILSVPPGHFLKIDSRTMSAELFCYYDISQVQAVAADEFDRSHFNKQVDEMLSSFFSHLNTEFSDSLFIVCLSGGLDSSLIATYAQRFLKNVVSTTFSYSSSGNEKDASEDFFAGKQIAKTLGLPFVPILQLKELNATNLDAVLKHCQDWRDFNVHCAWVNDQIGAALRKKFPHKNIICLTGDMMNEFLADYTSVTYKDSTYYALPKVSKSRLRRFLVRGLDTSDREIGIFSRHGINTIQPFSILAEKYLAIPADVIEQPNSKELLNLTFIKNDKVEDLIVKTKVRAQVGGKDGGTLGIFHDHGVTQTYLESRWESFFRSLNIEAKLIPLIICGRYRETQ